MSSSSLLAYVCFGALVGGLPTLSMLLTSLLAFNVKFSAIFESSAQNYCAGLILGAVAKELFPQISTVSKADNLVGISIGFFAGLFFINYLDYFVTFVENNMTCLTRYDSGNVGALSFDDASGGLININLSPSNGEKQPLSGFDDNKSYQSLDTNELDMETGSDYGSESGQDHPVILLASQATASPMHRERIRVKIAELIESVCNIERKLKCLHKTKSQPNLSEAEISADQIDEEIHRFQYKLDHCRRLIQGSGSDIEAVVPRLWITEKGMHTVQRRLDLLKQGAESLSAALNLNDDNNNATTTANNHIPISRDLLIDIHVNMDHMDHQILQLHKTVEGYSFKWGRRGKKQIIPVPKTGSFVPMSLIIPVIVDCIVDGFLIGSTSAISLRAGIILSFANMIEMGFLGLAVSVRVKSCTGSSMCARYSSLIVPPLIMLAASILGALSGSAAMSHPMVYIGFISFGIVSLLYLVVNELLVEAREALAGQEYWWTAMILFAGIYSVILMDILV